MDHAWVTDNGRVSVSGVAVNEPSIIEVTAQEQQGAIDRASLVSMIRARLKEKTFRPMEYLFKQVGWHHSCLSIGV